MDKILKFNHPSSFLRCRRAVIAILGCLVLAGCEDNLRPDSSPNEGTGTPAPGEDGSSCSRGLDCQSGSCLTQSESGLDNGYCTAFACEQAGCHGGACIPFDRGTSMCMDTCRLDSDCRSGYDCLSRAGDLVCDSDSRNRNQAPVSSPAQCVLGCEPGSPVRIDCGYLPTLSVLGATQQWGLPYEIDERAAGFALSVWPESGGRQVNLVSVENGLGELLELKGLDSALNVTSFEHNELATLFVPFAPAYGGFLESRIGILQVQSTALSLCMARSDGAPGSSLTVGFYLVGASGLASDTMAGDIDFIAMMGELRRLFALAGIEVGVGFAVELPAEQVDRYRIVRTESDFRELLSLTETPSADLASPPAGPMVLNLILVDDIALIEHPEAVGRAGLVPGPPGVHGTPASGIAVEMASFRQDPEHTALIIAHEAGHFLGLRHTSEVFTHPVAYGRTDPIGDTPECSDVLTMIEDCPDMSNLMFPVISPGRSSDSIELSAEQAWVLKHNPLVLEDPEP